MANDASERFLRAEEEAHQLVDVLRQLEQEANSYRTARLAIDAAASGVADLVQRLSECAGRLVTTTETLRSIGTPELLNKQEELGAELSSAREDITGLERGLAEMAASAKNERTKQGRLTQWILGLLLANFGLLITVVAMVRR